VACTPTELKHPSYGTHKGDVALGGVNKERLGEAHHRGKLTEKRGRESHDDRFCKRKGNLGKKSEGKLKQPQLVGRGKRSGILKKEDSLGKGGKRRETFKHYRETKKYRGRSIKKGKMFQRGE